MSKNSLWKDADIFIGGKKDDVYWIQCTQCKKIVKFANEELLNSTADNPIICGNCGYKNYLDKYFWSI